MTNEERLTTEQVARELGVTTSRVRQLLLGGHIAAQRFGDRYRGYWLIEREHLDNFKQTRRGPGRPKK